MKDPNFTTKTVIHKGVDLKLLYPRNPILHGCVLVESPPPDWIDEWVTPWNRTCNLFKPWLWFRSLERRKLDAMDRVAQRYIDNEPEREKRKAHMQELADMWGIVDKLLAEQRRL